MRRIRTALFVDFDNVYLGLSKIDRDAAEKFATDPGTWIAELLEGEDAEGAFVRRFLVMKCYLNPSAFSKYRAPYTRAGFQVVDTPSLTAQGKSAADTSLVLDAMDALGAAVRYDEFIIASADADFTPLVQRFRAADRQTTVITAGPSSGAYRSVADAVIDADALRDILSDSDAPEIVQEVVDAAAEGDSGQQTAARNQPKSGDQGPVKAVTKALQNAKSPLLLSRLAAVALQANPGLKNSNWSGAGTFSKWVATNVPHVSVSTNTPGYAWDGRRFSKSDVPGAKASFDPAKLTVLQREIAKNTDVPGLTAKQFAALFQSLEAELQENGYTPGIAAKVNERCRTAGVPVSQSNVSFVVRALAQSDLELTRKSTLTELTQAWAKIVIGLAAGARIEVDGAQKTEIREWVGASAG